MLSNQHCHIHPTVSLFTAAGERQGCPVCLMNVTMQAFERRVEDLESEIEARDMIMRGHEVQSLKSFETMSLDAHSAMKGKDNKPQVDHQVLMTERREPSRQIIAPTARKHPYSIGQIGQAHEMDMASSREDSLIKMARLCEGDGAWVKRSPRYGSTLWKYAVLQRREFNQDVNDCRLVFVVDGRGCTKTKTFPISVVDQYVRVVKKIDKKFKQHSKADQDDCRERKIFMKSSSGRSKSSRVKSSRVKSSRVKSSRGRNMYDDSQLKRYANKSNYCNSELDTEVDTLLEGSVIYTNACSSECVDKYGSDEDSTAEHSACYLQPVVLEDHAMSMYTLHQKTIILREHEVSMHAVCESVPEFDAPEVLERSGRNSTYAEADEAGTDAKSNFIPHRNSLPTSRANTNPESCATLRRKSLPISSNMQHHKPAAESIQRPTRRVSLASTSSSFSEPLSSPKKRNRRLSIPNIFPRRNSVDSRFLYVID